jgi:hypothetical protein
MPETFGKILLKRYEKKINKKEKRFADMGVVDAGEQPTVAEIELARMKEILRGIATDSARQQEEE